MSNKKIMVVLGAMFIAAVMLAFSTQPAQAIAYDPQADCEYWNGTWDEKEQTCTLTEDGVEEVVGGMWEHFLAIYCESEYAEMMVLHFDWKTEWTTVSCSMLPSAAAPKFTPTGVCKLFDLEDAALGTTVFATFKGYPDYLRLWDKENNQFYELPFVPNSYQWVEDGDGKATAEFYTYDPVTGAAIVPAGDYWTFCFGPSGYGGGITKVSITR
jgi:hypothetical protein